MQKTQSYTVLKPLLHDNQSLAAGSVIQLTPQQAHFLVLNGTLVLDIAPLPPLSSKPKKEKSHE